MEHFIYTFTHIVLPVILIVGVGALFDLVAKPDLPTLNRLNFQVLVPALIAVKVIESDVSGQAFVSVGALATVHMLIMGALAWLLSARLGCARERPVLTSSTMYYNAGNMGIPIAALAEPAYGAAIMAAILMVQNFLTFSLGIAVIRGGAMKNGGLNFLASLAKVPVIWAIVFALVIRFGGIDLPTLIETPLGYLGQGLIPVALITLGVQLRRSVAVKIARRPLALGLVLRLAVSPVIMLLLLMVWPTNYAGILMLAAGLPVAVNVFILASEYNQEPELASQLVFWSTILGAVTLPLLLLYT